MIEIEIETIQNIKEKEMVLVTFNGRIEQHSYKFAQLMPGSLVAENSSQIIQEAYLRLAMNMEMLAEKAKHKASETSEKQQ